MKNKISSRLNVTRYGFQTVGPMICRGHDKCPVINHCPVPDRDEDGKLIPAPAKHYPVNQHCIMELLYIQQHTLALCDKLNVDPQDPIEMPQINELAMIDTYKRRAAMILATGDRTGQGTDFMLVDVKGYDENGNAETETKLHPLAQYMESLEKRRDKVLERFLATRRQKQEIMERMGQTGESKLLTELSELREAILNVAKQKEVIPINALTLEDDRV